MNIVPHKRSMFEISESIDNNKPSCPRSSGDFKHIVLPSHQKDNKLVDNYEKPSILKASY